jgi:hypothetical protein
VRPNASLGSEQYQVMKLFIAKAYVRFEAIEPRLCKTEALE